MRKIFLILFFLQATPSIAQVFDYDYALQEKKIGNFIEAERVFKILIESDENSSELWFQLGLVQRFQTRFQDALESQQKAIEISPENNDIKLEIARIYLASGDIELSQQMIRELLDDDPYYAEAREVQFRIERIKMPPKENYQKWRLDLGREESRFSRVKNDAWIEDFVQIGFRPEKSTYTHVRFDDVKRFDSINK